MSRSSAAGHAGRERRHLDQKVVAAVDRLGRALRLARQDVATKLGLSVLQLQLVEHLDVLGTRRVGQLAKEFDVSQPTISDALSNLEGKGIIARTPDPADGRATVVSLAPTGVEMANRIDDELVGLIEGVRLVGDADQATTLFGLLSEIRRMQQLGVISINRSCLSCAHYEPPGGTQSARCHLLDERLDRSDLRVDCPDHESLPGAE